MWHFKFFNLRRSIKSICVWFLPVFVYVKKNKSRQKLKFYRIELFFEKDFNGINNIKIFEKHKFNGINNIKISL